MPRFRLFRRQAPVTGSDASGPPRQFRALDEQPGSPASALDQDATLPKPANSAVDAPKASLVPSSALLEAGQDSVTQAPSLWDDAYDRLRLSKCPDLVEQYERLLPLTMVSPDASATAQSKAHRENFRLLAKEGVDRNERATAGFSGQIQSLAMGTGKLLLGVQEWVSTAVGRCIPFVV